MCQRKPEGVAKPDFVLEAVMIYEQDDEDLSNHGAEVVFVDDETEGVGYPRAVSIGRDFVVLLLVRPVVEDGAAAVSSDVPSSEGDSSAQDDHVHVRLSKEGLDTSGPGVYVMLIVIVLAVTVLAYILLR